MHVGKVSIVEQARSSRKVGQPLGGPASRRRCRGAGTQGGDQIEICVAADRAFEVSRDRSRQMAIERLRRLRRPLPAGFTFHREEVGERQCSPASTFWSTRSGNMRVLDRRTRDLVDLVEQQIGKRGLRAFDLRRENGFLPDEAVEQQRRVWQKGP
jgi:hypothetical protein